MLYFCFSFWLKELEIQSAGSGLASVPLKVGASDGINRTSSMFGVTVPRWQNPTINPLTNNVLLSPTAAKGLLLYGVGAKVPAVFGDVNNAGGGK